MNCFNIPNQCFELIMDFASINWKQRFTLNVLPYIKTVHLVGVHGKCASCYIGSAIQSKHACTQCQWNRATGVEEMSFQEFRSTHTNSIAAQMHQAKSYEAFKNWCMHADIFYKMGMHMQIRVEFLRREFIRDMRECSIVYSKY